MSREDLRSSLNKGETCITHLYNKFTVLNEEKFYAKEVLENEKSSRSYQERDVVRNACPEHSRCLQPLNVQIGCSRPFGALGLEIAERRYPGIIVPFLSTQSTKPDGKYFVLFACIK